MLRLPPVEVATPRTLAEAARLLAQAGPEGMALAGGTDALPKLKRGQLRARLLVDLGGVRELYGVRKAKGRLVLGAGTRVSELLSAPELSAYSAVREAAACVATPQIRNAGTLGGNLAQDTRCAFYDQPAAWRHSQGPCLKLEASAPCRAAPGSTRCFAVSAGDLAPAFIALGARVRVVAPRGERELPLEELYRDAGCSPLRLAYGELVAEVLLPARPPRSTYLKLRRRGSFDFSALGAAVALERRGKRVAACRIALGGVASAPLLCEEAAGLLVGEAPTSELVAAAAAAAARRARPVENSDFSAGYRRRVAAVYVARALRRVLGGKP